MEQNISNTQNLILFSDYDLLKAMNLKINDKIYFLDRVWIIDFYIDSSKSSTSIYLFLLDDNGNQTLKSINLSTLVGKFYKKL